MLPLLAILILMKKIAYLLLLSVIVLSCKDAKKEIGNEKMMPVETDNGIGDGAPSLEMAFAQSVEKAHNKEDFAQHEAVSFDFKLSFGGQEQMDSKITMRTNSSKIKIENKDGSTILFDGTDVYVTPAATEMPSARFAIFTWPYFAAMPFKLTDPGTQWSDMRQTQDGQYSRAKLTFKENTGDTAEDWYIAFTDNKTNLLSYVAYIVTFGKSIEKAEDEPHAIVYKNYEVVDGVPISNQWEFYNWSEEKGLFGAPIGEATLSNITFTDSVDFTVPTDSKKVSAPQ